jgi:hypothetical protein
MEMKYCTIDTESGSRRASSTLLSAAFLITNDHFEVLDQLDLKLKLEKDGLYIVDAQGMAVNGIDIVAHDKVAMTYKEAKPVLYEFLKKNSNGERLTPVGHGVKGDIHRIIENLISQGSWEQFCTYHYIDTSVVLQFLRACGKMPQDCDGSVGALVQYFGIELGDRSLHDAMVDAQLTMQVYQKMVEIEKQ